MPIPFACTCGKRFTAKDEHAGKRSKCPACGTALTIPDAPPAIIPASAVEPQYEAVRTSPPPPPMRRPPPQPPASDRRFDRRYDRRFDRPEAFDEARPGGHHLTTYPVWLVLLLNFLTIGIFGMIRINLMHGQLPRVRPNDPSGARAVGFLFIPCFNLYWFFFTFQRLAERLNEQRRLYGLPRAPLGGLALAFCIGHLVVAVLIAAFFPAGIYINPWTLIIGTLFFTVVQGAVNEMVELKALGVTPPEASKPCPRCAEWVRTEASACRYCDHVFPEQDVAAAQEFEAEDRAEMVQRVVLRNKRSLRQAWGWTLVACGGLVLSFFVIGGIGALVAPPPKSTAPVETKNSGPGAGTEYTPDPYSKGEKPRKEMDVGTLLIGMSCVVSMDFAFLLLPGFYLLHQARRLGQELALLEAEPSAP